MSCEGCISDQQRRRAGKDKVIEEARAYAKEHYTSVAIYQEAGEWKFVRVDIAIAEHIPFEGIITCEAL